MKQEANLGIGVQAFLILLGLNGNDSNLGFVGIIDAHSSQRRWSTAFAAHSDLNKNPWFGGKQYKFCRFFRTVVY